MQAAYFTNLKRMNSSLLPAYKNANTHTQTTGKSGYLLDRNVTPPDFVAGFSASPLSDYSNFHSSPFLFLQLSPASFLISLPSPAYPRSFLLSLLLYLSLSPHLLSLPPSLPSALRQTLCWTQPEPSSPLLFPGSLSLCYVSLSFREPQSKPFPLSLSGCHHFLSTQIVPSTLSLSTSLTH